MATHGPLRPEGTRQQLAVEVVPAGPTKLVVVRDLRFDQRPGGSGGDAQSAASGARSQPEPPPASTAWEAHLSLVGVGLSLVDETPQEIAYVSLLGVALQAERNGEELSLELSVDLLQVDNALPQTPFPVFMRCAAEDSASTAVHAALVMDLSYEEVRYARYFALQLQEMSFMLDELLLIRGLHLFRLISRFYWERVAGQRSEHSITFLEELGQTGSGTPPRSLPLPVPSLPPPYFVP
jgi:vacuolar protein sorting-associated protein 13D